MFEDSLLESGNRFRHDKRRRKTTVAALAMQVVAVVIIFAIPLIFTEALPQTQMLTVLVAPPPPPPSPAAAAAAHPAPKVVKPVHTVIANQPLRTPTKVPDKVEMAKEEAPSAPPMATPGVVGEVPGGVPGGQVGGVLGGIINSTPAPVAVAKTGRHHPPAGTHIGGHTRGITAPQGCARLSAAGPTSAHAWSCHIAGRDRKRWQC